MTQQYPLELITDFRNGPAISMVVPFHNAQATLKNCVDSLLEQKVDMEIILIDDGSNDNSSAIAQELAQENDSIRLFSQINQGVASARNLGIRLAKGRYIAFIDADDVMLNLQLADFIALADAHNVEFFKANHLHKSSPNADQAQEVATYDFPKHQVKLVTGRQYFQQALNHNWSPVVWNGFYRTDFLKQHHLFFTEEVHNAEDTLFTVTALTLANTILVSSQPMILQTWHSDSLSNSNSIQRLLDYHHVAQGLIKMTEPIHREIAAIATSNFHKDMSHYLIDLINQKKCLDISAAFLYTLSANHVYPKLTESDQATAKLLFTDSVRTFVQEHLHETITL